MGFKDRTEKGKDAWRISRAEVKKRHLARSKKEAERKRDGSGWNYKLANFGTNTENLGNRLIRRVTIPIILFIIGGVTFPIGIIFWLLALYMVTSKNL